MSWMRCLVPSGIRLLVALNAVLSAAFFAACPSKQCHAQLCQGCCSAEGICLDGNTPEACGVQGEACMRCSGGRICTQGICLGGNPTTHPGSGGGGEEGGATPSSALWWIEDSTALQATLHRYLPELSLQTSFPFSSPVLAFEVSPQGKRWAVALATSAARYEVVHASNDKMHSLHTGSGVFQKMAFAEDSRGLAFLAEDEDSQGQLFWSMLAGDKLRRLSLEKCGLADSHVNVLDFAWAPDSSALAVRALLGDEIRGGIWLVTTGEPGTCVEVVHPKEAQGATPEWGAFGPLSWRDKHQLYFRASLLQPYPLQLYSFTLSGSGGLRNPLLANNTHSLLGFALHPPISMLALLQQGPAFSLLSLNAPAIPLPVVGCETQGFVGNEAMLFSPENDWLLLIGNGRSHLVALSDMQCSLRLASSALEAAWSPNGKFLAELSLLQHSAAWSIVLSQNNGKTLLNPRVVSEGFQHLHQLRWTAY